MTIESLKDLEKTIRLCRKLGVQSIRIGEVEFHLGVDTAKATRSGKHAAAKPVANSNPGIITEDTKILTDELTPEQLLFYSSENPADAFAFEQN